MEIYRTASDKVEYIAQKLILAMRGDPSVLSFATSSSLTRALILLGHGSHYHADSSMPTHFQADEIYRRGLFHEVLAAFWKEEPNLCHVLDLVESKNVFVVPYFISKGYFTEQVLPRELRIEGRFTVRGDRRIFYGEPVGTHPSMTRALRHCAEMVLFEGKGPHPPLQKTTLIIVGHGTTQNENSAEAILGQVKLLKRQCAFADVFPAFIEQEPFDRDVLKRVQTPYVVVVPFFISDGLHSREDIPVNMGFAQRGRPWTNPVLNPYGKSKDKLTHLWYARAIGSEPWMADVILDRVRDLEKDAERMGEKVGNKRRKAEGHEAKRIPIFVAQCHTDFISEIRGAGEVKLNDLLLRAEGPTFSACHYANRDTPVDRLEVLKQAEDAHRLGCYTEAGEYRPLRSAPTLRRGWILRGLSETEFCLFVDLIYPAAIAHHAMAKQGVLRVCSFEEVAARQSGLYTVIRKLKEDQVRSLAGKICGEGRCWKQPLWSVHMGEMKPVIQKVGVQGSWNIPCPEPCSYWISIAQQRCEKGENVPHDVSDAE